MNKLDRIPFGFSFDFLGSGMMLIFSGVICSFYHLAFLFFLIPLGLLLILLRAGIEIDFDKKQIRKYTEILGFRFGEWTAVHPFTHLDLLYSNESQTMHSRGSSRTSHNIVYDLILHDKKENTFLFYSFTKYLLASETLKVLSNAFNLIAWDEYDSIRSNLKKASNK